ncbi:MAG: hypothetical protein IJ334_01860, partial [Clostridia bacterium]|nr:hypothetical protein [Clostridia bacterium]
IPQKNGGLHGMGEMRRKYQPEHPNQRSGRSWDQHNLQLSERRAMPAGASRLPDKTAVTQGGNVSGGGSQRFLLIIQRQQLLLLQ